MKLEFSRHVFEKYSNIKFHKNTSSGSRVVQCGRTDEQTGKRIDGMDFYVVHTVHILIINTSTNKCP